MQKLDEHSRLLTDILSSQADLQGCFPLRLASPHHADLPSSGFVAAADVQSSNSLIGVRAYTPRLQQYRCIPHCTCACHTIRYFRSPHALHMAIGRLFVGYSGYPLNARARCTVANCNIQSDSWTCVDYAFPSWLLARSLTIILVTRSYGEINVSLRVRRLVSSSAEIFRLCRLDDVGGLRRLFDKGLASPNDAEVRSGATALFVSYFSELVYLNK